jgi:hypothetical protein
MTKRSRILIAVGALIFGAVGIVLFGFVVVEEAIEPQDPFARVYLTSKCSNDTSVVLYQRKTGWFVEETEWSVKQFDRHGTLIRAQMLFTSPHWNDSEMHRRPEEFCDDKYWAHTKQSFSPVTRFNHSLD